MSPQREELRELADEDWNKALSFCDRTRLTLPLGLTSADQTPERVQSRIARNLDNNARLWLGTKTAYREASCAFQKEGLEFAVLKGFSHAPYFVDHPCHRLQNDIDLYFPQEQVGRAREVARSLGYEPLSGFEKAPIDHMPTMIRKTGWRWRGDFFDPEHPPSLELHFRFWDQKTERFGPAGLESFWERRQRRVVDQLLFVALHPVDAVGYASLHMLRHLLRGDMQPYQAYELAWLLDRSAADSPFWNDWSTWHDPSLRRLEGVCFGLAQRWFDCRMPDAAAAEIEELPADVKRWLDVHAAAPLEGLFRPNKDELWLHWSLLDSPRSRIAVVRRRLLPGGPPGPTSPPHIPKRDLTWSIRVRWQAGSVLYSARRTVHHARALPSTALSAARWFGRGDGLDAQYWKFFFAAAFFNLGLYIFFLLYNLYLLQLGFREAFLGIVSSAMTTGSLVGCIPAAIAVSRFGVRKTLLTGFGIIACLSAFRALVTPQSLLVGLAFAGGLAGSVWAIAISPATAQFTNERNRSLGFSLIFSSGIGIGVLGGLAGGRLPGLLLRWHAASSTVESYRGSLLVGCAIVLLGLWPLSRLSETAPAAVEKKSYPSSPLIVRFLIAIAVWDVGVGFFNPFFSAFFARMHMPVERIGLVFSAAHLAQAAVVLLAPLVLRRFGLIRGISGMQLATALTMLCLAGANGPVWASLAFTAYTVSQYMSEPGTYTYLMDSVPAAQRSGASALNFIVAFSMQAIAAALSGALLSRYGYGPVLASAAVICGIAAALFRILLPGSKPSAPSAL